MKDLKELILKKRPTLSASSVTTYNSILTNLYKKVFGDSEIEPAKFDETEKILAHLKEIPGNKRKTILSALVIMTDDKKYRDLMLEDIKGYNHEIGKQEKSDSQKASWVGGDEIKTLQESYRKDADLLYKKAQLNANDLQNIQSYIILCLLGGGFIAPRRSKDFCDFKIKNVDKAKDNYLDKNQLVFNSYKTAKCYGEQKVEIPTALRSILNKWVKNNPTPYLLFDSNMNPLTSVKLNQRLNRMFDGKKVGCNNLRHSYLTDKYAATIKTNEAMANDLKDMGSSAAMATTYIKKD